MNAADRAFYEAVYELLVKHAGAQGGPCAQEDFVQYFATPMGAEFRFQGNLGFGGKFWRNDGRFYVSCYKKDETPELAAAVKHLNGLIDKVSSEMKPTGYRAA